jgi:hypothetical protein
MNVMDYGDTYFKTISDENISYEIDYETATFNITDISK